MTKLTVENLEISYGNTYRLTADFKIQDGRIWQVVGPSGSGKTTLLTHLLFSNSSHQGSLTCGETPVSKLAIGSLDYRSLFTDWTVKQNLDYYLSGSASTSDHPYLDALVSKTWYAQKVYALSNSQKKKLQIATLLEQKEQILVLDKLDDTFDPQNLRKVLSVISTWISNDKKRMAIIACKNPISSVHNVIEIVPTADAADSYTVKVV